MHNDHFLSVKFSWFNYFSHITMGLEPESVCMLYAKHKLYNEVATQKHVLCLGNRNAFWFDVLLANAVSFIHL